MNASLKWLNEELQSELQVVNILSIRWWSHMDFNELKKKQVGTRVWAELRWNYLKFVSKMIQKNAKLHIRTLQIKPQINLFV